MATLITTTPPTPTPTPDPGLPAPEPIPPHLWPKLIEAFFEPGFSLIELARRFQTTLSSINDWARLPAIAQELKELTELARLRAHALACERLQGAITALDAMALTDPPEVRGSDKAPVLRTRLVENARKAASALLRFAAQEPKLAGQSSPAHTPAPTPTSPSAPPPSVPQRPADTIRPDPPPRIPAHHLLASAGTSHALNPSKRKERYPFSGIAPPR